MRNILSKNQKTSLNGKKKDAQSLEDIAVFRAIPGMTVISPADCGETSKAVFAAAKYNRPVYIRLTGGTNNEIVYKNNYDFEIGKAIIISKGFDVTFIGIGETVQRAVLASKILQKENISSTVVSMHTLKPFDENTFLKSLEKSKVLISLEEHSINGGLGEKCASIISQKNIKIPFKIIGIPDEYMLNGSQQDVLDHYDMKPEKLSNIAKMMLKK